MSARGLPNSASPPIEEAGAQDEATLETTQPFTADFHEEEALSTPLLPPPHEQPHPQQYPEIQAGVEEAAEEASHVDPLVWASIEGAGAVSSTGPVQEGLSQGGGQAEEDLLPADAGLFSEAIAPSPQDPVPCAKGERGFPGMHMLSPSSAGGGLLSFAGPSPSHGTPLGAHETAEGQALAFLSEGDCGEGEGAPALGSALFRALSGASAAAVAPASAMGEVAW